MALAGALKIDATLCVLEIADNSLGDWGGVALATALKVNVPP